MKSLKQFIIEAALDVTEDAEADKKLDKAVDDIEDENDDKKDVKESALEEGYSKLFDQDTFEIWTTPTGKFEVRGADLKKVTLPDLNAAKQWIKDQSSKVAAP